MLLTSTANMSTGFTKKQPHDGEILDSWTTSNNLGVLYGPKETASFSSPQAPGGTDFDRAASFLPSRLKQKDERWQEAVNFIDFSQSTCNAWRTINKLTGMYGRSSPLFPVSANSITSQLVKNGAYRTTGASPPGSSTRTCPTSGRFLNLRVTVSLNPLDRRSLLLPSDA